MLLIIHSQKANKQSDMPVNLDVLETQNNQYDMAEEEEVEM